MGYLEPHISIVIPAYNEEDNILQLYHELTSVMSGLGKPYEVIVVNDGSTDNTENMVSGISDSRLKLFSFPSNKGKSTALSYGFSKASGDTVITLDADLQDDPREIPRFIEALKKYEVVSGWKYRRHDEALKKLESRAYNWLTSALTGLHVHDMNCGFKAYRAYTLKELKLYGELHRYILVMLFKKGYSVGEIKVNHRPRVNGKSKFGHVRVIKGFIDLIRVMRMIGGSHHG